MEGRGLTKKGVIRQPLSKGSSAKTLCDPYNPGVVEVLFAAIPAVVHVLAVAMLLFVIFAIVGVQLYNGSLHHCTGEAFESWSTGETLTAAGANASNLGFLVHPVPYAQLSSVQVQAWEAGAGHSHSRSSEGPFSPPVL